VTDLNDPRKGGVSSASLTDALGRVSTHRAHVLDLVSPTPGRVLRGRAVTIRFVPFRQDVFDAHVNSFARLFYEAVPADPEEIVLVLDSGGQPDISVGGGKKFSRLQNRKLAGLLTRLVDEAFQLAAKIELEDVAFLTSIRAENPEEIRVRGSRET
jgi:4-hydroxy-4-methyl-2-oxoglutarate aldolase